MITHTLLQIAIMIFAGMLCGRLVKQVKLPNVTGYLIAGLLLGPSVFNIIPETAIHNFTIISNAALGFIAFSIGTEFKISYFKRVGATPIVIAVFESLFAVVALTLPLIPACTLANLGYQAVKRPAIASFLAAARQGLFFIPLIVWLPGLWGLSGVQFAQALADGATFLLSAPFLVYFFRKAVDNKSGKV